MKILSKRRLTLQVFEDLVNNEVLINYYGSLNFDLANYLIENLKLSLKKSDVDEKLARKIYSSFVEGIQNIIAHQQDNPDQVPFGIVNVSKQGDGFLITLGNLIDPEKKSLLESKVEKVKTMSAVELREEFSKRLKDADPEKTTSAHLGLFQMAMNSTDINCYFNELENGELFFLVELTL